MTEFNKNKIQEVIKNNSNNKEGKFVFENSTIKSFKEKIIKNKPIDISDIKEVKESMEGEKVTFLGEILTIEKFKKISTRDIEISQEIMRGNKNNVVLLDYRFPEVELVLYVSGYYSDRQNQDYHLELDAETITDDLAEKILKVYTGGGMSLGLSSISDNVAMSLSKYGGGLHLNNLTVESVTINQMEILADHKSNLSFFGFTHLTDEIALILSKHKTGWLNLNSLTSITEKQAEILAKHEDEIYCNKDIEKLINKYKQK